MKPEQMLKVLDRYKVEPSQREDGFTIYSRCLAKDTENPTEEDALCHATWMLGQIRVLVTEGSPENWEKANRWLGFVQGIFWATGIYSIDEMADHNRPPVVTESD